MTARHKKRVHPQKPELYKIRDVQEADLQEVSTLAQRIWRQHYTSIIGAEQVNYMLKKWYEIDFLRSQMSDVSRTFLIVIQHKKIVGFIQSSVVEGFNFIHKLYIAPEAQGLGMGSALLRKVKSDLPYKLRVNRNNIDAIAYYKYFGFTITMEDILDIGNGYVMDDFIMECSI